MHILVVDDEQDVQPLFEQKFRKEIKARKIAFAFATSGTEALSYLNQHSGTAPLILSDINMPGMSGLELLRHIKQDYTWTPPPPKVMMITAYGDEENYQKAKHLGADDFLTKPLDFNLLKEKLQIDAATV
ncbi:MAG: response regulator [Bacteroidota bacterium]|nr:response regulator [Flavisolibacter sp.]MDQ3844280.1 response regulator [Bacteroidota bacterium]MBD0297169.1 response regulator [Flavisolibacter sp.]MBD0350633.1 response regulator [Flavisolibacter sp.]MBD0364941.1 response regulator [Flavisolibacter sp.]